MVKLNKIYTRTGDDGTTGLVDGSRRVKHSLRIEAFGTVDEANAVIGLARLTTTGEEFAPSPMMLRMVAAQVTRLENEIDAMNADLAPLTSFILPGGSDAAAWLHLGRTVARRAARLAVAANAEEALNPQALAYLNRLSDHLFVLGRVLNDNGRNDVLWVPGANR